MRSSVIKSITAFLLFLPAVLLFTACKKTKEETAAGFTWTHNGAAKEAGAYEAYISTANGLALPPFTIIAGYARPSLSMNIRITLSLSSFSTGSYTVSTGTGAVNKLLFTDDAGNYQSGVSGTVTITAYTGSSITGSFSVSLNNGSGVLTQLTGSFTKVPVFP